MYENMSCVTQYGYTVRVFDFRRGSIFHLSLGFSKNVITVSEKKLRRYTEFIFAQVQKETDFVVIQ